MARGEPREQDGPDRLAELRRLHDHAVRRSDVAWRARMHRNAREHGGGNRARAAREGEDERIAGGVGEPVAEHSDEAGRRNRARGHDDRAAPDAVGQEPSAREVARNVRSNHERAEQCRGRGAAAAHVDHESREPDHHGDPLRHVEQEKRGQNPAAALRQRLGGEAERADARRRGRGHHAPDESRARERGQREHDPQAAPAHLRHGDRGEKHGERRAAWHVGGPEPHRAVAIAHAGDRGSDQRRARDREQNEAGALKEPRQQQGGIALGGSAEKAAGRHDEEAEQPEALVAVAVAENAHEHPDQGAEKVDHRRDEPGLDERQAELCAHLGQRGRNLADERAAGDARGIHRPDRPPVRCGGYGGRRNAPCTDHVQAA